MTYTFFLDDIQIPPPSDWQDIEMVLKRDFKSRTISVQYSTSVTFGGAGYNYIRSKSMTANYCGEVRIQITESCGGATVPVVSGRIVLADCKWRLDTCTVECSIIDDGLGARVHNNSRVAVSPTSPRSKSLATIAPCAALDLTVYGVDGAPLTGTRRAFDWFDALRHAVAFITDGSVGVASDWYAALPDSERYCFAIGTDLRNAGTAATRISYSFEDLFGQLAPKYDLWIHATTDADGNAILRVEPGETFFAPDAGYSTNAAHGVVRSTDTDRLYSTVKVGSTEAIREMQASNPLPYVSLMGFAEETLNFSGQCNTDTELDLITDWVIDPNTILRCTVNNEDKWDSDMFVLQYTASSQAATMGQYLTPGADPWLHNEALMNARVLSRTPLRSSVGAQVGAETDNMFSAEYTTPQPGTIVGVPYGGALNEALGWHHQAYDDDFTLPGRFDYSNSWGGGTPQGLPVDVAHSRFIPTVQGMFVFGANVRWRVSYMLPDGYLTNSVRVALKARIYDAFDVLVSEFVDNGSVLSSTVGVLCSDNLTLPIVVDPSQYVVFEIAAVRVGLSSSPYGEQGTPAGALPPNTPGLEVEIMTGSTLFCANSITSVQVVPSLPVRLTIHEAEGVVSPAGWKELSDHPERVATFAPYAGHVIEAKRKLYGGITTVKIAI